MLLLLSESVWECSKTVWKDAPRKPSKSYKDKTMQQWLDALMLQTSYKTCPQCEVDIVLSASFVHFPYFIPFVVHNVNIKMSQDITIEGKQYRLCGLVYFGHKHYTCQIVDKDGRIWYNDSQENQTSFQGQISNYEYSCLVKCKGRELVAIIYCVKDI